ncbi:MAG: glycosyl hydrolase family 28-related protein [Planctomycetota bacterium]
MPAAPLDLALPTCFEPLEGRQLFSVVPPVAFAEALSQDNVYNVTDASLFTNAPGGIGPATPNNNGDDDAAAINYVLSLAVADYAYNSGGDPNPESDQQIIYLPPGVYHVAQSIAVPNVNDVSNPMKSLLSAADRPDAADRNSKPGYANIWLYGEGSGQNITQDSIIRLKNPGNTNGDFDDVNNPRGVVEFIPYSTTQFSNTSFRNFMSGLRVEVTNKPSGYTGLGHSGAVGVVWAVNNTGAIRDVVVEDESWSNFDGHTGITLRHQAGGPGLIEDVEVIGFTTGIEAIGNPSQLTIRNVTLKNQEARKPEGPDGPTIGEGIKIDSKAVAVEKLTSLQDELIPAIRMVNEVMDNEDELSPGHLTIIDSTLNYTGSGTSDEAIIIESGHIYARDVQSNKYDDLILDHDVKRVGSGDLNGTAEYVAVHGYRDSDAASHGKVIFNRGTPQTKSLQLGFPDAPEIPTSAWQALENGQYDVMDDGNKTSLNPSHDWLILDGSGNNDNDFGIFNNGLDGRWKYVMLMPGEEFKLDRTVTINANGVDLFAGQGASIAIRKDFLDFNDNDPDNDYLFRITGNNTNETFVMQGITNATGQAYRTYSDTKPLSQEPLGKDYGIIRNDFRGKAVFRDLYLSQASRLYRSAGNVGDTWFENVHGVWWSRGGANAGFIFNNTNAKVYARHLNIEQDFVDDKLPNVNERDDPAEYRTTPTFLNNGADVWMFGQKVGESNGVYWKTQNGGKTEVLGAFLNNLHSYDNLPNGDFRDNATNLDVADGEMSLVAVERIRNQKSPHDQWARVAGQANDSFSYSQLPTRQLHGGGSETQQRQQAFDSVTNRREARVIGLFRGKSSISAADLDSPGRLQAENFEFFGGSAWERSGESVWAPPGSGDYYSGPPTASSARIITTLTSTVGGTYDLKVRANSSDPTESAGADDSFYLRVNGGAWSYINLNGVGTSGWYTRTFLDQVTLNDGTNTIEIAVREDGTRLDWIELV